MSNLDYATLIIGFFAPLVIAKVQIASWPAWAKGLSAGAFELAVALLMAIAGGTLQGDFGRMALEVIGASIVGYQARWKAAMPELRIGVTDNKPFQLTSGAAKPLNPEPPQHTYTARIPGGTATMSSGSGNTSGASTLLPTPISSTPVDKPAESGPLTAVSTISGDEADKLIALLQKIKGG